MDGASLPSLSDETPLEAGSGSGPRGKAGKGDDEHREHHERPGETERTETRTVFVLNVAFSTGEAELKGVFQACGGEGRW